jgi:hypothetical protein
MKGFVAVPISRNAITIKEILEVGDAQGFC